MDLENIFTYHAPDKKDLEDYRAIREAAKVFAATILEHSPKCDDQSVAIRKVREAVMSANASIALKGSVCVGGSLYPESCAHDLCRGSGRVG